MSRLPVISGAECLRVAQRAGFYLKRRRGSHMIVRRDDPFCQTVIPDHAELDPGTLRSIIRHMGLTVGEFVSLLRG